ncbi:MAG: hypothetical protein FJ110_00340 [Deltaproteobacteria bacterium]|nr:hypothetical protein [Deltaproteobacteria bacterium]
MERHKKFISHIVLSLLFLIFPLFLSPHSFGATLNLSASWSLNTEPNIRAYKLFRTDGTRSLIATVPHPNNTCSFSVTFQDTYAGPITFVLRAVNTSDIESPDSGPVQYAGPTVTIVSTNNTATENPLTSGLFTVTRTGSTSSALTVYYTVSGTATPQSDYNRLPGSLTIPSGSSSATIAVTPVRNTIVEPDETVIVALNANATYTRGSSQSATVIIRENGDPGEETVTPPTTPTLGGTATLYTGTPYKFSTGGSSSSFGSPVEYQFSWGDGTYSSWSSAFRNTSTVSKTWPTAGIYQVMARARSKTNMDVVSAWSNVLVVTIQGRPFIQVTSPNGGENLVVGSQYDITWNSAYLNQGGTVYLFYWVDGAWRSIAALSPGAASYRWTVPRLPEAVTSPKPSSRNRWTSVWVGNWVNGAWEAFDWSDQSFRILYDGWVCKLSGADQGGATLVFDDNGFAGYGISLKWGMFEIDGTYNIVDTKGTLNGDFTIRDFNTGASLSSGPFTGSVDSSSKKLTLSLPTPDGTLSLSGARFVTDPSIPVDWTGALSGSASGILTSFEINPYEPEGEIYTHVFEFSGSGALAEGGSISIEGNFYYTSTANSFGITTNVYGIYQITGARNESGVLTGSLKPPSVRIQGSYSFSLVSDNGNKYTLKGNILAQ